MSALASRSERAGSPPVADDQRTVLVAINVAPHPVAISLALDGLAVSPAPIVLPPHGHRIVPVA